MLHEIEQCCSDTGLYTSLEPNLSIDRQTDYTKHKCVWSFGDLRSDASERIYRRSPAVADCHWKT